MNNKELYKNKFSVQLETLKADAEKIITQPLQAWKSIKKRVEIAWYSLKATCVK